MAPANRDRFLADCQRLDAAMGDLLPRCDAATLKVADRFVRHEVAPGPDRTWPAVDLATLDWAGQSTPNPRYTHYQLMMFGLFTSLASAYRHTADERYAASAREYFEAYLAAYPATEPWTPVLHDGATSFPHRIGSSLHSGLLGVLPAFLTSPSFDDAFFDRLVAAAAAWLRHLHRNIYPGRNIRILHGDVLMLSGLRLRFLPDADAWLADGVHILNDAVVRQIHPDGSDMEGSAEYHTDVLRFFVKNILVARAFPELGLDMPASKIAGMYDYAIHVIRPDGQLTPINDTGYGPGPSPFGEAINKDRLAFLKEHGLPEALPSPCRHFPHVGQIFLRDQWSPDATYLTFDATTRRGWHWHPGRNAIQLFAHGRPLLVDPGYPLTGHTISHYGALTAHHNTLNLNGLNQSHAQASCRLRQAPGYDLAEGHYEGGYWPKLDHRVGPGVHGEHHRAMLWVRGRFVLVIDLLLASPRLDENLTLESNWQFSEGAVQLAPDHKTAVTLRPDSNLLMLFPLVHPGMTCAIHQGERNPDRGWVPERSYLDYVPAPMLRWHVCAPEIWKAHLATVLVPFAGQERPAVTAQATAPGYMFADRTAGRVTLTWADGSRDEVVWADRLQDAIDHQHGLQTDAELVHLTFGPDGRITQGLAAGGRFLRRDATGSADLLPSIQRMA